MTGPGTVRFVEHLRDSTRKAGLAHDRVTVEHNRAVLPDGARAVKWLEPEPGTGHVEQGQRPGTRERSVDRARAQASARSAWSACAAMPHDAHSFRARSA